MRNQKVGLVNIFTKHTSCGLAINENCDPDVRQDMETIFSRLVPEYLCEYRDVGGPRRVVVTIVGE
ncbi:MAG: YjbQ family protein [Bacteroidaceae bacterium]|nr:YjbQ family protein [Bacteroidaceae bacterium]